MVYLDSFKHHKCILKKPKQFDSKLRSTVGVPCIKRWAGRCSQIKPMMTLDLFRTDIAYYLPLTFYQIGTFFINSLNESAQIVMLKVKVFPNSNIRQ